MFNKFLLIIFFILALGASSSFAQEEPPLPQGLEFDQEEEEEPGLPEGLSLDTADSEKTEISSDNEVLSLPFDLTGFWELRAGLRIQDDPYQPDVSIGETRLRLEMEKDWEDVNFKLTTDFLYDPVLDNHDIRLKESQGWLQLREAVFSFSPVDFADIKAGRQILTWGTGDLLFINDLFPKSWKAFFIGRDTEYLKAPTDAVKTSFYTEPVNLDLVYMPVFDSDRFIDGTRVSYWNQTLSRRAGEGDGMNTDKPNEWFQDDELAWRLFKNLKGYELAFYGYRGFWKSPGGQDLSRRATFPALSVYGGSVRGQIGSGIGNVEAGYYDSEDDRKGDNPLINNNQFRALAGYEQEVASDFTAGFQYYLERMLDYGNYRRKLPSGVRPADQYRHVLTLRLTKLLMSQNLKLSLFTYYSPSDKDTYLRPQVHYKINDYWTAEVGGNVFMGEEDFTFFGQFEKNNNIYTGVRYSF